MRNLLTITSVQNITLTALQVCDSISACSLALVFSVDSQKTTQQFPASLLLACYLAVIKRMSGCVHIACFGLMIISPLQVVNRLDATMFQRFVSSLLTKNCNKHDFNSYWVGD